MSSEFYNSQQTHLFKDQEYGLLRSWNNVENELYPLILKRQPSSFLHFTASLIVNKNNTNYSNLLTLINNYFSEIPKGTNIEFDATSKYDFDEFVAKQWFVIDLRKDPDISIKNRINLINWNKLTPEVQARVAFEIIQKIKGCVIFADTIFDIPHTCRTMSVLALTEESTFGLTQLCREGCNETPKNQAILVPKDNTKLNGYHRFDSKPTFCYWPPY